MQYTVFDEGTEVCKVSTGWTQEKIAAPQCTQIKIQLALCFYKQDATAFFLQYRTAVSRLEIEVSGKIIKIPAIGLCTKVRPAAQTAER